MESLTLLRDMVTIGLWWLGDGGRRAKSSFPPFAQKSPKEYWMTFGAREAVPVLVSTGFTHCCVRAAYGMVPVAMRACKVEFQ
jgi:hypothetical protein